MLIYPDHLQNWLDGHFLLIYLILVLFWLSEMGQIWGFQATHGEPIEEMAWHLHADVSWASSELSRLWPQFVDFSNFGTILTSWNGSNLGILVMLCGFSSSWCPFAWNWSYLGFLAIIWRTCWSRCRGGSGGIFPTLCVEFCLVTKVLVLDWKSTWCTWCLPSTLSTGTCTCTCKYEKVLVLDSNTSKSTWPQPCRLVVPQVLLGSPGISGAVVLA